MPNLVKHGFGDVFAELVGIVTEVAYERVAEDQDLVRHAAAAEEGVATQPRTDVHAVRGGLPPTIGNDGRDVLQPFLEFRRELIERRAHERLELLLAVMPAFVRLVAYDSRDSLTCA